MPSLSVLIHVRDSDRHLGRTLETLRPADEVVVVSHTANGPRKVAQEYGAKYVEAVPGVDAGAYAVNCAHEWVLCLRPDEALSEGLEAAVLEWKASEPDSSAYAMTLREQRDGVWSARGPQTRLVNRTAINWKEALPPNLKDATPLAGDLLRFPEPESPPPL